jgi:hypothetical protein
MSTTKITIGVAGLLCLLAVGTASYETVAAHHASDALALTRQSEDAMAQSHQADAARIQALEARVAALTASAAAADSAVGASSAPRTAARSPGESARGSARRAALFEAMNSPQLALTAKLQLDNQYAPLFRNLQLTPDQTEQFKNLLLEKRAALVDAMTAAQDQGLDPTTDPRGFYMAVVNAEQPINVQIGNLLGAAGVTQYQQYVQELPAQTTTHLLQQTLSYTATPLTDAQASGLTQILAQYSPAAVPEPFALLNTDLGVTTFTPQALTAAQSLLSGPQLQALQAQIAQQQKLLAARQTMMR